MKISGKIEKKNYQIGGNFGVSQNIHGTITRGSIVGRGKT